MKLERTWLRQFLNALDPDLTVAAMRLAHIERRLTLYFERKGVSEPDELVYRTLDRAVIRLPISVRKRLSNLSCLAIARKVLAAHIRQPGTVVKDEPIASVPAAVQSQRECVERCMKKLKQDETESLIKFYFGTKTPSLTQASHRPGCVGTSTPRAGISYTPSVAGVFE